jgi:hypothetical protein
MSIQRGSLVQRGLLWCGAVGSVLFIVIFLISDAVKPDYDPVRDAVGVSMPLIFVLALGASETAGIWQRLTNIVGWTWLTVLAVRALAAGDREQSHPERH